MWWIEETELCSIRVIDDKPAVNNVNIDMGQHTMPFATSSLPVSFALYNSLMNGMDDIQPDRNQVLRASKTPSLRLYYCHKGSLLEMSLRLVMAILLKSVMLKDLVICISSLGRQF